jgi:hypothetical protein
MIENIPFWACQIFFELIFGPPTLIYVKFGPLAKKAGHPCSRVNKTLIFLDVGSETVKEKGWEPLV